MNNIDVRNNKISMDTEEIFKLANKLKKFKQLKTLNMEQNRGINLTTNSKESRKCFIKLVESLPASLKIFNN